MKPLSTVNARAPVSPLPVYGRSLFRISLLGTGSYAGSGNSDHLVSGTHIVQTENDSDEREPEQPPEKVHSEPMIPVIHVKHGSPLTFLECEAAQSALRTLIHAGNHAYRSKE
jgi:hypothetical protein